MSPANEVKVGAFVITSFVLLFGGVIALGSGKLFQKTQILETSTRDSVDGLQVGSPVKYRGVPIGEVSAISFEDRMYPYADDDADTVDDGERDGNNQRAQQFDYGSPVVIRMEVRLDIFGPERSELFTKDIERGVTKGLRARMRSAGLTGGLFVELDMADPTEYPAYPLAFIPDYPFVPSAPSRFNEMITTLERISSSLGHVDFEGIGAGMKGAITSINRVLDTRVDKLLVNADDFIAELSASNKMLQTLISNPKVVTTIDNAAEITTGLRTTLPAAVREYGEFGAELNGLLSGEEYELRRLLSALRETADNLEVFSDRARQDPTHILFSKPPRKLAPGEAEK